MDGTTPILQPDTAYIIYPASGGVASLSTSGNVLLNDTDPDGDQLAVIGIRAPPFVHFNAANVSPGQPGSLSGLVMASDGTFTFTDTSGLSYAPHGGQHIGFSYYVDDGHNGQASILFNNSGSSALDVWVFRADAPPTAVDDQTQLQLTSFPGTGQKVSGNVLANDTDPDADLLVVFGVQPIQGTAANVSTSTFATVAGKYGQLTISGGGNYTYTVTDASSIGRGLSDTELFSYSAWDGYGGGSSAYLKIKVTAAADKPPTPLDDRPQIQLTTKAGTGQLITGNVLANDTDPENDPITLVQVKPIGGNAANVSGTPITVPGKYGSLTTATGGDYTYTVTDASSIGVDRGDFDVFSYAVSDVYGFGASASLIVFLAGPPDTPPVAADDTVQIQLRTAAGTGQTASGNLVANDFDADGDPLTLAGIAPFGGAAAAVGAGSTTVFGKYGELTVLAGGSYTYLVNDASGIAPGHGDYDAFSYSISDGRGYGSTASLIVDLEGSSTAPLGFSIPQNAFG